MVAEAIDNVMRRIRRLEALEYSSGNSDGNILTNPGFEIWQRGTGPFVASGYTADRWYIDGTGATVSVAPNAVTIPTGSMLSARVVFTPGVATIANLLQHIENGDEYHELVLGFTAQVYASLPTVARIWIRDGIGAVYVYEYSTYHSGTAGWEYLSVVKTIRAGIDRVSVGIEVGRVAATVFIDNACLMVNSALPYTPRHPSDDWDRCLRYYETGHLCWRGYTPDADGIWLPLTFVERKCAVPTITMSGGVYDIYGTVLSDSLVALDENTMCWQLASTGAGVGEVTDRHWIAESNCEPRVGADLYLIETTGRILHIDSLTPAGYSFRDGGLPGGYTALCITSDCANRLRMYSAVNGTVWTSTDGGVNWSNLAWPATGTLKNVYANTSIPGEVWASVVHADATSGHYKSTDYGANWVQKHNANSSGMAYNDPINVTAQGLHVWTSYDRYSIFPGETYYSDDGGTTWNTAYGRYYLWLRNNMARMAPTKGATWTYGLAHTAYGWNGPAMTTDGWVTPVDQDAQLAGNGSDYIMDIGWNPAGTFLIAGATLSAVAYLFKSTDAGASWVIKSPGPHIYGSGGLFQIAITRDNVCYYGSDAGYLWYSFDSGETWSSYQIDRAKDILVVHAAEEYI